MIVVVQTIGWIARDEATKRFIYGYGRSGGHLRLLSFDGYEPWTALLRGYVKIRCLPQVQFSQCELPLMALQFRSFNLCKKIAVTAV